VKKPNKRYKLNLLALREGSVVTQGANPFAHVVLFKSAETTKEEGREVAVTELEKLAADLATANATVAKRDGEIGRLEKALGTVEADLRSRTRDIEDLRRELDRERARNADPEEELLKGMPEAAQRAYLAQKAQTERLQKRLDEADTQAKLAEIAKAFDAEFPGLPAKGTAVAPILKAVYGVLDADAAAELRRLLKAGSDALDDIAKLRGAIGNGGRVQGAAEAQVEKLARERAKREGITYEKAYRAVLHDDSSLYERIRAEQN
jgi:predicted  nucleic acid-binding Zn-ribbon protein